MENIHLEIFYGDKAYSIIHTLYLQLRNYNVEVQVASEHFKHQGIDMFTKKWTWIIWNLKCFFSHDALWKQSMKFGATPTTCGVVCLTL